MLIIENRRSCSFKCYNILISLYFISRLNNSDSFIPCLHIFFPALQLQIPFLPYCLFCSVDFSNVVIARIINAINSKHVSITALIFSIISSLLQYVTSSSSKFIFITIGTNPSPFEHAQTISIHSPHAGGDADIVQLSVISSYFNPLPSCEGRQHKPPKIHPDLRQLTQQNHDTPLFRALQAPLGGAKPDIQGAKPPEKS